MRCNFQITQQVEFDGSFGNLDIHNAYDLVGYGLSDTGSEFQMEFRRNRFALPGRPASFLVEFSGVRSVKLVEMPADIAELIVQEVGFMAADDTNYQWALDDGEPADGKDMVFKGDGSRRQTSAEFIIRVSAEAAFLRVTGQG